MLKVCSSQAKLLLKKHDDVDNLTVGTLNTTIVSIKPLFNIRHLIKYLLIHLKFTLGHNVKIYFQRMDLKAQHRKHTESN